MPIYEYDCQKCGHRLEVMQKMDDKPLTRCPKCKGKLEKIFSQTSFQLKGGGWYASDYAAGAKSGKKDGKETKEAGTETKETRETKETKETKEKDKKEPAAAA
ncbi:MAG: FmdB family zinc ribbon protein [Blastocatellia bacterium]